MEGTDPRDKDSNEEIREDDAPGMLDPEAQQEEVEDPGPSPAQDYGKVIHFKRGRTDEDKDLIRDADVVIVDQVHPVIVKNREGVTGIIASPDILDQAEVVE